MFRTGDTVVYGIHGVCQIVGMETQRVDRRDVTYMVLEPVSQPGSRYMVPTHNEAAMGKVKQMLSREALETLITSEKVRRDCWIRDEGQRKQTYRELISSGDREKLMAMVHTLYQHRAEQIASGRKIHLCDENFLRDAEKLLTGEIAVVMGFEVDEARQYVRTRLKEG